MADDALWDRVSQHQQELSDLRLKDEELNGRVQRVEDETARLTNEIREMRKESKERHTTLTTKVDAAKQVSGELKTTIRTSAWWIVVGLTVVGIVVKFAPMVI